MADQVDKNSEVGKEADLASRVPNVISIPEITNVSVPETEAAVPAPNLVNDAPQPADLRGASAPSEGNAKADDREGASRGEPQVAPAVDSAVVSKPEETPGGGSEFKLDPSRPSVKDSGRRANAKGKGGKKGAFAKENASKRDSAKESSAKSSP